MTNNPESSTIFDAEAVQSARLLLSAMSAHDTGESMPIHLPKTSYESPLKISQMAISGLLHAAERSAELRLDQDSNDAWLNDRNKRIQDFAAWILAEYSPPEETPQEQPVTILRVPVPKPVRKARQAVIAALSF